VKRLLTLILALLLSCSTSFSLLALGTADDESVPPWIMQSHTMQDSYLIFDRQKQNTLFEKDSDRIRPEPLSLNLLLLLVVTERLDSNIQLTVSQDSANLSLQENIMGIRLKAGQRYPWSISSTVWVFITPKPSSMS
jgi:D-alanyl-D-alanine carboxypeptidase